MPSVLITGCSSGFGLETARYFLKQGWRVIATMRHPDPALFPQQENLSLLPLDVTDPASIAVLVANAGEVDVLVNNAGIGMISAVESTPLDKVRDIFETNTFGTIAMVQALLPQFRKRRAGTIINVTSTVTVKPLPLLAIYSASKAAVEMFSQSMAHELAPFNIRVRIVQPGLSPTTRFGENALPRMDGVISAPYAALAEQVFDGIRNAKGPTTDPAAVAAAVWHVATDPDAAEKTPAGEDAVAVVASLK